MSNEKWKECAICLDSYDDLLHKPVMGSCGHTICNNCADTLKSNGRSNTHKCPLCSLTAAFERCVINYQLLDAVSSKATPRTATAPPLCSEAQCCVVKDRRHRVCMTCRKPKHGGKGPDVSTMLTLAMCAECEVDFHGGHTFVTIPQVMGETCWKSAVFHVAALSKAFEERGWPDEGTNFNIETLASLVRDIHIHGMSKTNGMDGEGMVSFILSLAKDYERRQQNYKQILEEIANYLKSRVKTPQEYTVMVQFLQKTQKGFMEPP